MDIRQRFCRITEKTGYYREEVAAVMKADAGYRLGFGFLLVLLFPVLMVELLIVLSLGKDPGIFVQPESVPPSRLIEDEVPEALRDLIPLARKYGIGDEARRDEIMRAATPAELAELEQKVLPRAQEIADWLDTFPEAGISDTAASFLYLGSACDEVPLYKSKQES